MHEETHASAQREQINLRSYQPPPKRNAFGSPDGKGPESALGSAYTSGGPPPRRFDDGQKVLLDDKEWEVLCGVAEDGCWFYDLLRSVPRQVDFAALRKRNGTGEVREHDEVLYDHKEFQHHARVVKIHRGDQNFYCDVCIIKRMVEENRLR